MKKNDSCILIKLLQNFFIQLIDNLNQFHFVDGIRILQKHIKTTINDIGEGNILILYHFCILGKFHTAHLLTIFPVLSQIQKSDCRKKGVNERFLREKCGFPSSSDV